MVWFPLCLALGVPAAAQDHRTWKDYGGGPDSSKYVALDQITKANVSRLQVAWTYSTGDNNAYLFNPIIVDNVMYVLARNNSMIAMDAATGKEIWIHENLRGIAGRGINYWESKDRKDRRLILVINNNLQELDARTGQSILTFGNRGLVSLREGLGRDARTVARIQSNGPGKVFENLLLIGSAPGEGYLSPPGDVRAYDVITGKLVWVFHTIPHPGEYGYDTWPKDAWKYSGGANTWGEISIDEKRGIVYFPLGSATYDYYGADRPGTNLFANCLLALDARTGKRLWHFQLVHHDLWDYDATSAPQLLTVQHEGKKVDAVAQAGKNGFLYVFERVTGKPLWPIEERPVPPSQIPGEHAWPTQPIPTAPPPLGRQGMTAADVNPYLLTPEEQARWKDTLATATVGMYTPISTKTTIALPGARGGSNWGTTAADPEKGMLYVTNQDWPSVYKLSLENPYDNPNRGGGGQQQGQEIYRQNCQICHGADRGGSATAPSLVRVVSRLNAEALSQVVQNGKGKMPAFSNLTTANLTALYGYLSAADGLGRGANAPAAAAGNRGPVVASGGAPGGLETPPGIVRYNSMGGPQYPEGIEVPKDRYYTDWGTEYAHIIGPPWSTLIGYDLNTGTVKWRVPLGEDKVAQAQGAKDTGILNGGERHGMVVTKTGLLFIATRDGKVRAHDTDTGQILWTGELPAGSEGIPAMYEVNGRQYLVVQASSPISQGRREAGQGTPPAMRAYVAFALPEAPAKK